MSKKTGSLTAWIVAGLALGVVAGLAMGPAAKPLGIVGALVIQAIKLAAAPLLMLAIVNAVLGAQVTMKGGLRMAFFAAVNASLALGLGLLLSNLLRPGEHLAFAAGAPAGTPPATGKLELARFLSNFVPPSLVQPFADNAVFPMVVMALTLGVALRTLKDRGEPVAGLETALAVGQRAFEVILGWIVALAPLAVFAVVAKSVGEYGLAPIKGLAAYVGVGLLGLTLHPVIVYNAWLIFYAKTSLGRFWSEAKEPAIYSIGANSSLATLPLTLRALDNLKVSKASSALGACVGTNLNNDGIILYEAMAVLFVAQAHGLHLSLGDQFAAAMACLVAAMGIAGVPEAGFISLSLVLATVGLPTELLPLLLTVDWILARARSVVNVLSDMMVSILIDQDRGSARNPAS
jgi:Na+/H+-dicarboxylate symporter